MENQLHATITTGIPGQILVQTNHTKEVFDRLISFFRTIENRFWDAQSKQWSFPIENLQNVETTLGNMGFTVTLRENKPLVQIVEYPDICNIYSEFDPDTYEVLMKMSTAVFNRQKKCYQIPLDQMKNLIDQLNEKDIDHTLEHHPQETGRPYKNGYGNAEPRNTAVKYTTAPAHSTTKFKPKVPFNRF
jgi:hypothetical protein